MPIVSAATTVEKVHIVIATAEPRGAYHLHQIGQVSQLTSHTYTHLLPYPEAPQGKAEIPVSSDISTLQTADRVVVTGGTFTTWTKLVAHHAQALGIPVIYTEVSYLGRQLPPPEPTLLLRATAMSPHSANSLETYLETAQVEVTGTPALDKLPRWRPQQGRALLLSTSDSQIRDRKNTLRSLANTLQHAGWQVRVRLHPREDSTMWRGYELDHSLSPTSSVAESQVVIGYPGSVHVVAAAVGAPVISLAPTAEMRTVLSTEQKAACSAHTRSVEETMDQLPEVKPAPRDTVAHVVGPIGGAAERVTQAWVR